MRKKASVKMGILMLAFIFLASMAPYSIPQGSGQLSIQGKPDKPGKPDGGDDDTRELYKVTITMNGGPGFGFDGTCDELGYVYAEGSKKNYILQLAAWGMLTPGPNGEEAPLTMKVNTGSIEQPIVIEGCSFWDGCHGNPPLESINEEFMDEPGWDPIDYTYSWNYEGILLRFMKSYDGLGDGQDVLIRWGFDYVPGPKKHGVGWVLASQFDWQGPYVKCDNPLPPEGLLPGMWWESNITGTFQLIHDGVGIGEYDPENNRVLLPDFDIHLKIERLQ